jgi:DNA recombination-dependent growth factor C
MEEQSKICIIDLDRGLHAIHCGHEDNVCNHLQNLADMQECLAAAGKDINNNQFVSLMLTSLPPSYHAITSSIIVVADIRGKILSPQIVAQLIMDKYQQCTAEDHRREDQSQRKRRRAEARHHHKRKRQEP